MKIAATVETVRSEIECPACHGRHVLIEGNKAKCAGCSNVWNWRKPPQKFKGAK